MSTELQQMYSPGVIGCIGCLINANTLEYTSLFEDTDDLKMALWARKGSGAFERRASGRGQGVVFLGKALNSHGTSIHGGV